MQNLVLFNVKYSQGLYYIDWHFMYDCLKSWEKEFFDTCGLTVTELCCFFACLTSLYILYWILIAFKGRVKNVFTLSFLIKELNSMFVALIVYNFWELTQVCNPWCSWWWNFSFYKLWLELQWLLSLLNYFILNWQIVFLMELHWDQSISVWN